MQTTPASPSPAPESTRLLGRNMALVCLAQTAGYGASAFLAPLLPLFLVSQGHAEAFIGLVLGAFNVASFASRPVWGMLSDRGSPRPALIVAGLLVAAAYAGYLLPGVVLIFGVRAVQGIGWGGVNVVGSAWVAALAPVSRRAEALGWYTMAQRMGTAVGPVSALWSIDHLGYPLSFLMGACAAGFIAVAAFFTRSTRAAARPAAPAAPRRFSLNAIVEPGALLGAGLITLMTFTGPAMNAYMPLYFRNLGLEHVELYYLAFGATGIVCRPFIGRFADRMNRLQAIALGFALQVAGLAVLVFSGALPGIVAGMVVHTVGYAISEPCLYALALDRSPSHRRGAAMATVTMAFQLGGGLGASGIGALFQFVGYREAYALLLLPVAAALVVAVGAWWRLRRVVQGAG